MLDAILGLVIVSVVLLSLFVFFYLISRGFFSFFGLLVRMIFGKGQHIKTPGRIRKTRVARHMMTTSGTAAPQDLLDLPDPDSEPALAPCIVLGRATRSDEAAWQDARSCLGGIPPIAPKDWPVKHNGRPMHCVAQIDLSQVAQVAPVPMATTGLLAFFTDTSVDFHTGAVRFIPSGNARHASALPPIFDAPFTNIYEEEWDHFLPGYLLPDDVPKAFPRWPLESHKAHQSDLDPGTFAPSLDDLLGPQAKSIHLDVEGVVAWTDDRKIFRVEDAAPFPVLAARKVIAAVLRTAPSDMAVVRKDAAVWQQRLAEMPPYDPLGSDVGAEFTAFIEDAKAQLRDQKRYLRLGGGTTVTAAAALHAYFEMYSGDREAFEAIPDWARSQIETTRMRTGYRTAQTHQMFGYGAQIQGGRFDGDVLLMQIATDEAVGFMWGDVGVLQWWILPDDLAAGRFEKARFVMEGH